MTLTVLESKMATRNDRMNPPELYLWALGRCIQRFRNDQGLSQTAMGQLMDMSQAGYWKVEHGATPNMDAYLTALNALDKNVTGAVRLAQILVRGVQAEEDVRGKLSEEERESIASSLLDIQTL